MIIKAQGLSSQLDQYTIRSVIEQTEESSVMIAAHTALGIKVVMKAIPTELYEARSTSFSITEVEA